MPYRPKKSGGKWVVSKKRGGQVIHSSGHFSSKAAAIKQIQAINISEHKRGKR